MLIEDTARVAAYDDALRRCPAATLAHASEFRAQANAQGMPTFDGVGWALRPLFVDNGRLRQISRQIHRVVESYRSQLLDVATHHPPEVLADRFGVDPHMLSAIDFLAGLQSQHLLDFMRPDGFWRDDTYVVTELNLGNGGMITLAESQLLHRYFAECPATKALGLDAAKQIPQPLRRTGTWLRSLARKQQVVMALLVHREEYEILHQPDVSYLGQLNYARDFWSEQGIETRIVFEDGLYVDDRGIARFRDDELRVDLVYQLNIGFGLLAACLTDEKLRSLYGGARVGHAPFVQALSSFAFDKVALPSFPHEPAPGLRFAKTIMVNESQGELLRTQAHRLVLKRAIWSSNTIIGPVTAGRRWNRQVAQAISDGGYIAQTFHELPSTTLPVTFDNKHIEWIKVRVEISPFILCGEYAGAFARYAPDEPGVIMSPPPKNLGLNVSM